MKLSILFRASGRRSRCAEGMTLVELLVAMGAGLIVLGAFVGVTLNVNTMVKSAGNYGDLDALSRNTLDMMSRDIRNASAVSTGSTTGAMTLTNNYSGATTITYSWDGSNVVTRTYGSGSPQMVLTNCDYLSFEYFMRVPGNNLQFTDITNAFSPSEIKLVSVSWRCSRSILGAKLNTESVQTATVCLRN
ncbi:MAG TPA: hypothetical protein VGY98_09680 [Verrucomicrobiae bacterium]|nr:hypothetical protein [Verrucomicrobiae bacterium]